VLAGGLHYDERFFAEPTKFVPERFAPEEKQKLPSYCYLPFGVGPRNCIGMRLAQMEVKLVLVHLVRNYVIKPSPKLAVPFTLDPKQFFPKVIGGMWLRFEKRQLSK